MLPNPGVTAKEPFTSTVLGNEQKRQLLRNLHRLISRAERRVRTADKAAIAAEFDRVTVRPTMQIDIGTADGVATLEKLLAAFHTVTPYLVQPDSTVRNQPFPHPSRPVLDQLVLKAVKTFDEIAGGAADGTIATTFGGASADQLAAVRKTFARASTVLSDLNTRRLLFADTRGGLKVQGAAATTRPGFMLLPLDFADAYTDDRVRTLLHETFHAVDAAIIDHVYATDPSFAALGIAEKLTNADHYADVARTHAGLQAAPSPALTVATADGVVLTSAEETKVRDAALNASSRVTKAWVRSLWDWQFMGRIGLYTKPDRADDLILRRLRRISELTGLTLHQQASADRRGIADALKTGRSTVSALDLRPFPTLTEYDQAVLEEIVADTHRLVSWIHDQNPVVVTAGTAPRASAAWLAAAAVKDPNVFATRLALDLVERAVLALPNPWLSSSELVVVVEALRMEASV